MAQSDRSRPQGARTETNAGSSADSETHTRSETNVPAGRRVDDGATRVEERGGNLREQGYDHPMQESLIGTDGVHRTRSNASWGAIFAGVATFLGLTLVLNIATAAMGLQGVDGMAAGIWSIVTVAIALAVAGFVAGALAVRAGLLHGFLTWATSMLAVLVLAGWLGTGMLGAAGNLAGGAAQTVGQGTTITAEDITAGVQDEETRQQLESAQQDVERALEDAQRTLTESTDDIAEGAWWAFAGALIGAALAAGAGLAGSRSVINRDDQRAAGRAHSRR